MSAAPGPSGVAGASTVVQQTLGAQAAPSTQRVLTLQLRRKKKTVSWNQDVVDNEGLGRKSSKKCCIYHKPRAFDESSSESDYSGDEGRASARRRRRAVKPEDCDDCKLPNFTVNGPPSADAPLPPPPPPAPPS